MAQLYDYVMIWRDGTITIVGPFSDFPAACRWGQEHGSGTDDDPRWHTVKLPFDSRKGVIRMLPEQFAEAA